VAFVGAFDALGIQTALGLSLPSPTIFAQYFVFAVLLGGIYGLIALGLTMIFGVMDVINFAHGALMVVAMYAVLVFSDATGLSPFFAIPFAVLLLFVFGVVIYRSTIAPIIDAPQENQLIVTFGVLLILISGVEIAFGSDPRQLGLDLGSLEISGVFVPQGQLYALIIALVALSGTWLFLQRTMLGRAIRGTADNRDGAQYVGIDVPGSTRSPSGSVPRWRDSRVGVIPLFQSFTPALGDQYPDKRVRRGRAGRARILPRRVRRRAHHRLYPGVRLGVPGRLHLPDRDLHGLHPRVACETGGTARRATMSNALSRAVERYGAFRDEWYALPALVAASLILLAAMPFLRQLALFGYAPLGWLSLNMLIITLIWATTAQAWNIMSGYTGQFSFGHAAFFGLGAYATIIPDRNLRDLPVDRDAARQRPRGDIRAVDRRVDLPLRSGGALLRAGDVGVRGAVAVRVHERSATRRCKRVLQAARAREYADGPGLAAFQFTGDLPYYYLILGFLTVVTVVSLAINRSQLGYYLFAIREREQAAAAIGVPTYRYKLLAVAVSAFFHGVARGVLGDVLQHDPSDDGVRSARQHRDSPAGDRRRDRHRSRPDRGVVHRHPGQRVRPPVLLRPRLNNAVYGVILIAIVLYSPKGVVSWPSRFVELLRARTDLLDDDAA